MLNKFIKSSSSLTSTHLRAFSNKVLISNRSPDWNTNDISSRYSKCGQIAQVQLIKNSMGQNTGKAVVEFKSEKNA